MEFEPAPNANGGLRRRHQNQSESYSNGGNTYPSSSSSYDSKKLKKKVVRKLDMFPKIEQDLVAKSSSGNKLTTIAYILTILIILAEIYAHSSANNQYNEHVTVDKSIMKKMRVDLNITFPSLHCDDVHMNIMDVAGDSHNDVDDTLVKKRLHLDGRILSREEVTLEVNKAHKKELDALEAIDKSLAPNYCGPCYGAGEEGECCNHCDDVLEKYKKKQWSSTDVKMVAEQCLREGRTKPKRMKRGEGCNIAGYMKFNRVNGNFHIAMGEGVERNGQNIHTFLPDDVGNFNASHIIHQLQFGPEYKYPGSKDYGNSEQTTLENVKKIVTEQNGVSGMFQYFIQIVPTKYVGKDLVKKMAPKQVLANGEPELETNRYFTTERFTPLMLNINDENWELGELVANKFRNHDEEGMEEAIEEGRKRRMTYDDDDDYYDFYNERQEPDVVAGVKVGGNSGTSHHRHENHRKQQAILPGIFFIYQVYPFEVEVSKNSVPLTHLFIRILSTIGGVFSIVGMIDTVVSSRNNAKRPR
jgi:hypothetical protein